MATCKRCKSKSVGCSHTPGRGVEYANGPIAFRWYCWHLELLKQKNGGIPAGQTFKTYWAENVYPLLVASQENPETHPATYPLPELSSLDLVKANTGEDSPESNAEDDAGQLEEEGSAKRVGEEGEGSTMGSDGTEKDSAKADEELQMDVDIGEDGRSGYTGKHSENTPMLDSTAATEDITFSGVNMQRPSKRDSARRNSKCILSPPSVHCRI